MHVKVKDTVLVLQGKDRGSRGKVLSIDRSKNRVLVEGVNKIKKHVRANPKQGVKGGILEREAPVQASNLMVVCPRCSTPTRVGFAVLADGGKARQCKRDGCGQQFDA
jgi:large subunit ribosomal protein L24